MGCDIPAHNSGYKGTSLCTSIVLSWYLVLSALITGPLYITVPSHPPRFVPPLLPTLIRCYILHPLQVLSLLIPPPPRHPCSRPPSRPFTEVQNFPHHNIMSGRIMPPHDVGPDLLKSWFHHCRRHWRMVPTFQSYYIIYLQLMYQKNTTTASVSISETPNNYSDNNSPNIANIS